MNLRIVRMKWVNELSQEHLFLKVAWYIYFILYNISIDCGQQKRKRADAIGTAVFLFDLIVPIQTYIAK